MQKGFLICMPLLDASPYDCILDNGKELFKVQVKSIFNRKKTIGRDSIKINVRTGNDYYAKTEVDYFAVYHNALDGFFIIKNHQQKSFRIGIKGKYKNNFNNFDLFY
jgi:hypothetical protein